MEERALDTIKTMLSSRGIDVSNSETVNKPLDETKMHLIGGILVIFSEKNRVTEKEIRDHYLPFAIENNYKNGMLIVSLSNPSESVLKSIREFVEDPQNFLIQIFDIRTLQVNITESVHMPYHRKVSEDEKTALSKKYDSENLKKVLPWLSMFDPGAKWIGARQGDVVEIIRYSETAGAYPYWRYCVGDVSES
jgi:DNA-directed RNA polymerase subunit H (RpoH/RPB5)